MPEDAFFLIILYFSIGIVLIGMVVAWLGAFLVEKLIKYFEKGVKK